MNNEELSELHDEAVAVFDRTRQAHEATTPDEWLLGWFEFNRETKYYITNYIRPMILDLDLPGECDWDRSALWMADDKRDIPVHDTDGNYVK